MVRTKFEGVYTRHSERKGTVFVITYQHNGKTIKKTLGADSEGWTTAKAYKERNNRIYTNMAPSVKKDHISLDIAFDDYMLSISHKPDTRNTKGRYTNHIQPLLGDKYLDKIKVSDINKLRLELSQKISTKTEKPLAPKTQNDVIDLIHTIFNYYNRINYTKQIQSPADVKIIDRLKVDNSRLKFLTKDEFTKLLWHIKNRNAFTHNRNTKPEITEELLLFTKLLTYTGVRTNSALTIRIKDIDLINNTITIKNHKSDRIYTSYIHPSFLDEITALCNSLSPEQYIFGHGYSPLHRSTLNRRLQPILDKVFNEHITDRREKTVVHTLRHTFGSWLVQKGTSLYIVAKLMDHSDISQTQVYAKLAPSSGADAVMNL